MIVNYIDLGVHYGDEIDLLISQYTPRQSNYDLRVYGIEANSIITNALKEKYIEYSDIIQVFNYAVADKDDDKTKLFLTPGNNLGSSIYASKNNVTKEYIEVTTIKLSTFISKYVKDFDNAINILKINIEGAELLVYRDLIQNELLNNFTILCGHPSHDIEKVPELYNNRDEYYNLINDYNIYLEYFCAESSIEKCINIFDKIETL